ncbi:DUF2441 domain-containing protein [Aliivibrio salmonicida]|uniref:DUF2441 domain-containing protein n=1 Tax=Aliivibrio salmonicida TaxID=40269 RepID=UPI003D132839
MKKFYAVDREGKLKESLVISLTKHNDISPPELQSHVNLLFPNGFSVHGDKYFLNNASLGNLTEPAIELMFEYVRQSSFNEIPSRFQSFFACETLVEALQFKQQFGTSTSKIFEVYSDRPYFKGNMNLLQNGQSVLVSSFFAHEYWKGNSGPDQAPFWEVMLSLPITVGKEVA